jgi:hypothetical protein
LSFTAVRNQASAPKSYKVTASNLANGLTALITASSGYEISLKSDGVFSSTLTLTQNVTNGISTDVFVRLKATATAGTISGTLQHSVAGLSKVVSLSATVAAPTLSVSPISLTAFSTKQNQPSTTKSYTLAAFNLANGLKATVAAPTGYEISILGTNIFSSSLTLTQTTSGSISQVILVRLKAQTAISSVAGNITNIIAELNRTVAVSGTVTP